ncbi:MAG: RagB/SusD family nutrient uptake outer membrane protein [Daejeonella sp.]|uniref:RagB/SusD family nutrient uptake outer membrane protein n=1 Tax=Daejeonella sp. TaxID=2805397 RepID=UPI0027353828|nr:RagB/SusD family nutrient uptake outer membrane protein [Daejeonella sp.]MDP3468314.1 RagB/SusD family nutrient uptake outer membrane protein [Daejeonella sp.]
MKKKLYIAYSILALLVLSLAGCDKNYSDPARATQDDVNTSTKGLTGVAVSLQSRYAAGRGNIYNTITMSGFLANELVLLNQGNTAELQLSLGGATLDGANTVIGNLWSNSNKIIFDANLVITNSAAFPDKALVSGLVGYATIFKALALGDLAAFWERVPAGNGENVTFITRAEAYTKIIADIDLALAGITQNPISTAFLGTTPAGIDIPNTLRALKARYALYNGNFALALSTANSVDLSKKSGFQHNATVNQNGIYVAVTGTNNLWQPINNTLGLPTGITPDPADKRLSFYLSENLTIAPRWRMNGFAAALTTEWPVYLPGEMTLIKAEAYARQTSPDAALALIELNKIITKKPAADPYGVGADLSPLVGPLTQAQLITEIYKQRSIEMFLSGQRLEDSRRLGRAQAERKRNFVNYPFRERDQNPNTPADPSF